MKSKKQQADWYIKPKAKAKLLTEAEERPARPAPNPIQLDGVFVSKQAGPYQVIGFGGPQNGVYRGVSVFTTQGSEVTSFVGRYCKVTVEVVE